ncbi:MAG: hypothetical protein MUQ65_16190 [Armatimonadetes bacterium]|nr:hypothetical protein [Armatimonadota bacterium]
MGIAGRTIKVFADGADLNEVKKFYDMGIIDGFTSNPFFLKKYGVTDYQGFIKEAVQMFPDLSMSFEVLSDDLETMESEALKIASWSENCHIKVPITNTKGESTSSVIKSLSDKGVKLNVTVIFTMDQVRTALNDYVRSQDVFMRPGTTDEVMFTYLVPPGTRLVDIQDPANMPVAYVDYHPDWIIVAYGDGHVETFDLTPENAQMLEDWWAEFDALRAENPSAPPPPFPLDHLPDGGGGGTQGAL